MGTVQGPVNGQFLRYCQLLVIAPPATSSATSLGVASLGQVNGVTTFSTGVAEKQAAGTAIDLSDLRVTFEIRQSDLSIPNTARIRVYNLSANTQNRILAKNQGFQPSAQLPPGATPATGLDGLQSAGSAKTAKAAQAQPYTFNRVQLTAGYQNGNKGIIFQGDIIRYSFGRERNVDSFVELVAADGDSFYNGCVVSQSVAAGATLAQQLDSIAVAGGISVDQSAINQLNNLGGIIDPRGKVSFGLGRLGLDNIARQSGTRWSIQNGVLYLIPVTGYLPGQAVQINSATGMIGTPEATDGGVIVRCYLNPLIKIGQLVQINQKDINQTQVARSQSVGAGLNSRYYPATVTNDGLYRVLVHEINGDTRGNDFYSELTCLAVDRSAAADQSVDVAS